MQLPHSPFRAWGYAGHNAAVTQSMATDRTRTAILNAAERLYAERGFSDVTLRDIVAEANVNLAAVNYHFGSKDELIAELFVTRSIATNRERLGELKAVEDAGGGRAPIESVMRALVGPTLRGCLGPDRQRSTAARFMIRASIEAVPPIRKIRNREISHLRRFAAAMRRSLPVARTSIFIGDCISRWRWRTRPSATASGSTSFPKGFAISMTSTESSTASSPHRCWH